MESNRMLDRYFESARNTGPSLISPEEAADLVASGAGETVEPVAGSGGLGTGTKVGVGVATLLTASIVALFFLLGPQEPDEPTTGEAEVALLAAQSDEGTPITSDERATLPSPPQQELREKVQGGTNDRSTRSPRLPQNRTSPRSTPIVPESRSALAAEASAAPLELSHQADEDLAQPSNTARQSLVNPTLLRARAERVETTTPELNASDVRVRQISALNTSAAHEYNPLASPDGERFYFTSNSVNGLGGHDIWLTRLEGGSQGRFSAPVNIGSAINSSGDEGGVALSLDGMTMIYTSCHREDGRGDCDLYEARYTENGWQEVRNLRELNTSKWEANPTLSSDGTTLYFVSNRPGTLGGGDDRDIFVARLQENGTWSRPTNLGPTINTTKKEDSPFIPAGSSLLYFSSEGHDGIGGYDFFVADAEGDGWGGPRNLGQGINTERNERFLSVSAGGDRIYFARDDDEKHFDLWMVERQAESKAAVLTGRVRGTERIDYIRADLIFVDRATGRLLGRGSTAGADGRYMVVLGAEELRAGGEIDVYGDADSLGTFRGSIDLPSRTSYATYRIDLEIESRQADRTEESSNAETLAIEREGSRLILHGSEVTGRFASLVDGDGVVQQKSIVAPQEDGDGGMIEVRENLPHGLYLVRTEAGATGVVRIR